MPKYELFTTAEVSNFEELRSYAGGSKAVTVTDVEVGGLFSDDVTDRTSADDGQSVIVDYKGRRWKRAAVSSRTGLVDAPTSETVAFDVVTTNPAGRLSRFTVENNQDSTEVDINFRACTVNIGDPDPEVDPVNGGLRLLQPLGSSGNMLKVYRPGSNTQIAAYIGPNGTLVLNVGGLAGNALVIQGSSTTRFLINEFGDITWYNAGVADVTLKRLGASILGTDTGDKFVANAGLGVGNSAAATVLGSVVKKIEVFDAAGASLGFLPVYNTIT